MKYRTLGATGLRVSVVGVGTWQFGGEWGKDFTQEEVTAMFRRAEDLGINLLDTAECYGDHLSEALVGGAIAGRRDKWIVATKFGHKFHGHMNRSEPRSPADVQKQLEDSLRALRTDYVDIYQYHSWGDQQFDDQGVLEVLRQAVAAGKVRHLGNSIGSNDNLYQTQKSGEYGVEVIQLVYNRLDRRPEQRVLPECSKQNLGVLARVPLASGFLSGKYRPGSRFEQGDVRHGQDPTKLDDRLREVERIAKDEVPPGVDMAQWALAWCLRNPAITCVIPGCKSVEQVESNAAAAELVDRQ
jgi:aryl-alcohol dehydrogenase-like predicted oxidoreductase